MKKMFGFFTLQGTRARTSRTLMGDDRGSIAILAAVALTVLMIAAGVAVDGMRYFLLKSELRNLADAAAVAAGANPLNNNKTRLDQVARLYIDANAPGTTVGSVGFKSVYDLVTQKYTVNLTAELRTTFLNAIRVPLIPATATAEIERTLPGPMELALALDMTVSMYAPLVINPSDAEVCPTVNPLTSQNDKLFTKLDVLRCAFTTLILDLSAFVEDATTEKARHAMKVGAVPFASHVNVGKKYTSADWLSGATLFPGLEFTPDGWKPIIIPWSGCVGYRSAALRASLANPTGNKYPRANQASAPCPSDDNRIVPLRSVYAVEDRKVLLQSLTPNKLESGSVLPSGLLWAWQLLDNDRTTAPSPACDPDSNASLPDSCNPIFNSARTFSDMAARKGRKAVILFTDGWNSWGPDRDTEGFQMGSFADKSNTDMANLCTNIKQKNIELYVVSFLAVPNGTEKSRLMNCASPGRFLEANSAQELIQAFRNIAAAYRPVKLTN